MKGYGGGGSPLSFFFWWWFLKLLFIFHFRGLSFCIFLPGFTPLIVFSFFIFPTTSMLRVSFSPVPECDVSHCWKRASGTPRATRPPLLLLLLFCTLAGCYCYYTKHTKKQYTPLGSSFSYLMVFAKY